MSQPRRRYPGSSAGLSGRDGHPPRPVDRESGSAIIEFIAVAVIVMVPLMYLIVAVAVVQRTQLAGAEAAREVGRAYATSPTPEQALPRAAAALRLAMAAQGIDTQGVDTQGVDTQGVDTQGRHGSGPDGLDRVQLRFVAAGTSCTAPAVTPQLSAGSQFTVCVRLRVALPAVPEMLAGRGITVRSEYVVHIDDFRAAPRG